jgi:hypothetical protein
LQVTQLEFNSLLHYAGIWDCIGTVWFDLFGANLRAFGGLGVFILLLSYVHLSSFGIPWGKALIASSFQIHPWQLDRYLTTVNLCFSGVIFVSVVWNLSFNLEQD